MEIKKVLEILDMEVDKRLYGLTQKELVKLLMTLTKYKNKKDLAKLISDDQYFKLNDLLKSLEKGEKKLLFRIVNEPKDEMELRQPIANWLKAQKLNYDFEVSLPDTRRKIDVVGCTYSKYGGVVGEDKIVAVEIKTAPTRTGIDSAFSQAKDYVECSDYSYVAVSPYVFLKYSDVLLDKVKKHKREIGLLLVDKFRVITEVEEAKDTEYNDKKYEEIKNYFKKK